MSIQKEIEKRVAAEMAAQAVPMSRTDQVIIHQSEPDASGIYISSDQRQQDLYNQRLLQQQAMNAQMAQRMSLDSSIGDGSLTNPNYRLVEPTTTTADANGKIIIY